MINDILNIFYTLINLIIYYFIRKFYQKKFHECWTLIKAIQHGQYPPMRKYAEVL